MMRRRFMNSINSVPLTFEALEDGLSITFSNEILYCINGGTWETLLVGENTKEVNKGSVISFQHSKGFFADGSVGSFYTNKKCNVYGACSSIIPKVFGDKFMSSGLFQYLFYNCSTIVDASRLELPAMTLAEDCYRYMFSGCSSLTTAPELPATTLAKSCYTNMFEGCTSLTTARELPAMTLAEDCYRYMFSGCTSLIEAPELPATTLAEDCYTNMFEGCTSLTTARELPATTLATGCYERMFYGCTSLIEAPELPATTLAKSCYYYMFSRCNKLSFIKMLATDISANTCLYGWVYVVASTGVFVKNKNATWTVTGPSGVPRGWTIKYE